MRRFDVAWLLLWGAISSAWCLSAAPRLSATFDEPYYVQFGIESWRSGSNREMMKKGCAPLPIDIEYLPIYIWEQFRDEPFDATRDVHAVLPYARAMNLVFWWMLLVYGSLVARHFGGPWASRFAVVLFATEPSFLAHTTLATTDIAVTAFVLAFAYHFERGRDKTWFRRWLIPGALYGLAMAAKVSALTFVPIVAFAFEFPHWVAIGAFRPTPGVGRIRHFWRAIASRRRDYIKIIVCGFVVVFAYCGCDWTVHPKIVSAADKLPADGRWTPMLQWLANHATIFPNAGEMFQHQIRHNLKGHGTYILGDYFPKAVWNYFPVALSIKLTLPVLALLAGLLIAKPRAICSKLGLLSGLLLLFSLNCHVQIGVRLLFPLVAFLLLTVAVGLVRAFGETKEKRLWLVLTVLSIICTIPAATVWPDGLRYSNELWGGPNETYRHLSDSNADWGQGVKDLDAWTAKNDLPKATIWYYGFDPAIIGTERSLPVHQLSLQSPDDVLPHVRGKVVAVSTTLLYGNPRITPAMPHGVEFFHKQKPIGRTRTFFVYDFRQ
jgi:hypothetical protein